MPGDPHAARVRLLQAPHGVGVPGGGRQAVYTVLPARPGQVLPHPHTETPHRWHHG